MDYLVDEGVWKAKQGVIKATGLGPEMKLHRDKLVREIEEREMEEDLRELVVETWKEIEDKCVVKRKKRYG